MAEEESALTLSKLTIYSNTDYVGFVKLKSSCSTMTVGACGTGRNVSVPLRGSDASRCTENSEEKMKRILVISALLLLATMTVAAQMPGSMQNPVSSALRDILPSRQKETVAAVEAMPADKFNSKPTADQRTFGQLVTHMADANYFLCSKAASVPASKIEGVTGTDSKDKLVAALKASFDFCSDALAKMDDSTLAETTEGFGGKQVTRAWFSLTLAGTWADHYAETAMYLRLNGVLPPSAKK